MTLMVIVEWLVWEFLGKIQMQGQNYVENWSMLSDLVIAAKTATVVFRGAGAY